MPQTRAHPHGDAWRAIITAAPRTIGLGRIAHQVTPSIVGDTVSDVRTGRRSTWLAVLSRAAALVVILLALGPGGALASRVSAQGVAEVTAGAPVAIQAAGPQQRVVSALADSRAGGWVVLTEPNALFHVSEAGAVRNVPLPPGLRGWQLNFVPLSDGWAVATDRVFPGGRREEATCAQAELGVDAHCGLIAAAELSPSGRWTRVRRLSHSAGRESSGFETPTQAVAAGDGIALIWCKPCLVPTPVNWIAVARPGGRFGAPHPVQRALRRSAESEEIESFRGSFYVRAQFGPHGQFGGGRHIVEREINADGSLGAPHYLSSPLIRLQGLDTGPYAGGENAEEYVFSEGQGGRIGVARRRGWETTLGPAHVIASYDGCCLDVAQTPDDWTLIVTEALTHQRWQLVATEVAPDGRVERTRGIEDDPFSRRSTYGYVEAVNGSGEALIASSNEAEPQALWLHGDAQRCRTYSRTLYPPAEGMRLAAFAGAHGVFHLVWPGSKGNFDAATVHVGCAHR